ncbi:PREDICTED: UDP-N-acetylglucosamine transferase subunit ALG14 homolog, partial [Galeopterus variegatus]|uniref:UDP-N-acetylglucosamine transferase subunit ALG14 n=1 Tax=Galeopterus variegatus TaxID=482537 RepID=A0ABM0SGI7_GALVR
MGCVLLSAAAAGAVAVCLVLRLWIVLHSQGVTPRESLSLLVVAGSGGHTTEILRLLGSLSNAYSPRHYIIADTDEMSAKKINSFELDRADRDASTMYTKYYIHQIPRSREVQQSWLSTVITTLRSMWISFPLIHRVKPDLVCKTITEEREDNSPVNPSLGIYTKYYIHQIPRSREVQQSWLSTVITTLRSMWISFPLIHRVKPDL